MKAHAENRKGASRESQSQQPEQRATVELATRTEAQPQIRISEIYASVQGEGLLTGTPSMFVRTSGCNLRCWFCDTPFASSAPEGEHFSLPEIDRLSRTPEVTHVVLTGGEPMIFNSIGQLCQMLRAGGRHLTIETAGTLYRNVECDLMSISPKLSSSAPRDKSSTWHARHQSRRDSISTTERLMREHAYQLKFVVDSPADATEVQDYLAQLRDFDPDRVLLMPQGVDMLTLRQNESWLRPWCEEHGFQFCPRSHIEWFGNRRGT